MQFQKIFHINKNLFNKNKSYTQFKIIRIMNCINETYNFIKTTTIPVATVAKIILINI